MSIRTRVRNGRLVVDEPCDLPNGVEVEATVTEIVEGHKFHEAIDAGLADGVAGHVVEHDDVRRHLEAKFGRFPK